MARARGRALNWYSHLAAGSTITQTLINVPFPNGAIYSLLGGNTAPASDAHEQYVRERGDSTVTRIIGDVFVTAGRSAGAIVSIGVNVFMGIILVPFEVYAGSWSAGGQPSPAFDLEADWLWHKYTRVGWRTVSHQVWNGSTVVNYAVDLGGDEDWDRIRIDVRGQRRIRKGELPVLIMECYEEGASGRLGNIASVRSIRVLLREP